MIPMKLKTKKTKKEKVRLRHEICIFLCYLTVTTPVAGGPLVANLEEAKRLKEIVDKERNGSGWEVIVDLTERNAEEPSPARRQHRHESPDDASPPRRQQRRESSDDASPPRRQQRRESSDDASPPRRRQRRESSDDASPPRRQQRRESPDDASPPRRPKEAIGDQKFMSDGTIAGMVAGTELAEEMARKREREAARFAALNAEVTGHGAATVYRNKITGKTMSRNEYEAQNISERQKKAAMYEDQSSLPWGGGLKQRDLAMTAQKRMSSESGRGYDVVAGMAESDRVAKEALRWGDPMAHLVKKKHVPTEVVDPLLARASDLKRAGFKIPLQIPPHSWLKRGVGPPLNRYNIKPGRHWDGVDRSNGFEKDLFKRQNELRAREAAAHMMAQEDM